MATGEIVLPITTPETEWVRGRALRKMSPTRDHGRLQLEFASLLNAWSRGRGEVATEWRFRIAPPGEVSRPLVPDIAFVAFERLRGLAGDDLQAPPFAPNVAVEILSPRDEALDVVSKVDVYLRGGGELAIVVDSQARTLTLYDDAGPTVVAGNEMLRHAALPGFELVAGALFASALDRPR